MVDNSRLYSLLLLCQCLCCRCSTSGALFVIRRHNSLFHFRCSLRHSTSQLVVPLPVLSSSFDVTARCSTSGALFVIRRHNSLFHFRCSLRLSTSRLLRHRRRFVDCVIYFDVISVVVVKVTVVGIFVIVVGVVLVAVVTSRDSVTCCIDSEFTCHLLFAISLAEISRYDISLSAV